MNDSDDKQTIHTDARDGVKADETNASFAVPSEKADGGQGAEKADIGGIVAVSVKAVAVAMSLVVLITSILCVALPLSAMRVFNNLGMYERALTSGTRYIDGEIKRKTAGDDEFDLDHLGRYFDMLAATDNNTNKATALSTLPDSLNNDDFIEALDVCVNLSDKLMREYAKKGETADAKHFAEYLERFTRYYSSIYGVGGVFDEKDARNKQTFKPVYQPFVYSTRHSLMTLNYRARYYLGNLDEMLCYDGYDGATLKKTSTNVNTYNGTNVYNTDGSLSLTVMNGYIDYIDQISEYIAVEFEKCGMTDTRLDELSETRKKYENALTGDEFELFVTKADGFTRLYEGLKAFPSYAQAAVSYNAQNADEQLRQLYWVQKLATAATRLANLDYLLWFNREHYGNSMQAINDEYGRDDGNNFRHFNTKIIYANETGLDSAYDKLMKNYIG